MLIDNWFHNKTTASLSLIGLSINNNLCCFAQISKGKYYIKSEQVRAMSFRKLALVTNNITQNSNQILTV